MRPNHRDGCDGASFRISGEGYNRVRVCACGAEDHEPDPPDYLFQMTKNLAELHRKWAEATERLVARFGRTASRRRKRHARYRHGREGVRPRLRGRR